MVAARCDTIRQEHHDESPRPFLPGTGRSDALWREGLNYCYCNREEQLCRQNWLLVHRTAKHGHRMI